MLRNFTLTKWYFKDMEAEAEPPRDGSPTRKISLPAPLHVYSWGMSPRLDRFVVSTTLGFREYVFNHNDETPLEERIYEGSNAFCNIATFVKEGVYAVVPQPQPRPSDGKHHVIIYKNVNGTDLTEDTDLRLKSPVVGIAVCSHIMAIRTSATSTFERIFPYRLTDFQSAQIAPRIRWSDAKGQNGVLAVFSRSVTEFLLAYSESTATGTWSRPTENVRIVFAEGWGTSCTFVVGDGGDRISAIEINPDGTLIAAGTEKSGRVMVATIPSDSNVPVVRIMVLQTRAVGLSSISFNLSSTFLGVASTSQEVLVYSRPQFHPINSKEICTIVDGTLQPRREGRGDGSERGESTGTVASYVIGFIRAVSGYPRPEPKPYFTCVMCNKINLACVLHPESNVKGSRVCLFDDLSPNEGEGEDVVPGLRVLVFSPNGIFFSVRVPVSSYGQRDSSSERDYQPTEGGVVPGGGEGDERSQVNGGSDGGLLSLSNVVPTLMWITNRSTFKLNPMNSAKMLSEGGDGWQVVSVDEQDKEGDEGERDFQHQEVEGEEIEGKAGEW
eukprot:GHVN01077563.1.p1 GENE.GHVN01077563.1~~GHVN01077563.1.p1  ORF type:complete len:555 (-),score=69.00 GHVN01077563.1:198-1862(-)